MAACPHCKKAISRDEMKCRYCGNDTSSRQSSGEAEDGIPWLRLMICGVGAFLFADTPAANMQDSVAGWLIFALEMVADFAVIWLLLGTIGSSWQGVVKMLLAALLVVVLIGLKGCNFFLTYGWQGG